MSQPVAPEVSVSADEYARFQAWQRTVFTTPKQPSKVKAFLKKSVATVVAIFSTPEAIKAEKSIAVVALGRAAILVPSAAVLIDLAVKALS